MEEKPCNPTSRHLDAVEARHPKTGKVNGTDSVQDKPTGLFASSIKFPTPQSASHSPYPFTAPPLISF